MRTSSEIETISKRASRAAGYTWGVSEEVGNHPDFSSSFDNSKVLTHLTVVSIPDDNLRAKLEQALGKRTGQSILPAELSGLTQISANSSSITKLTGLEQCKSLTRLELASNQISNLSPLTSLTNLTYLSLIHNI